MCLKALGKGFSCETEMGVSRKLLFLVKHSCTSGFEYELYIKFNRSFTNRDCLHCAILKALYAFKEKRARKAEKQEISIIFL